MFHFTINEELYLILTDSFEDLNPYEIGFDASVNFVPNTLPLESIEYILTMFNSRFKGGIVSYDHAIEAIKSPCPYNGCTKREEVKSLLQYLNTNIDTQAYEHLAAAMRLAPQQDLWPEKINRDVLAKKHRDFWYQKSVSEQ